MLLLKKDVMLMMTMTVWSWCMCQTFSLAAFLLCQRIMNPAKMLRKMHLVDGYLNGISLLSPRESFWSTEALMVFSQLKCDCFTRLHQPGWILSLIWSSCARNKKNVVWTVSIWAWWTWCSLGWVASTMIISKGVKHEHEPWAWMINIKHDHDNHVHA